MTNEDQMNIKLFGMLKNRNPQTIIKIGSANSF